jgi:rod shape-determining protein MreB
MVIDVGDDKPLHAAIASYILRKYNTAIGERTAEQIKVAMGSAMPLDEDVVMDVRGRDQETGLPRTITINAHEVTEAMTEPLEAIIQHVRRTLEALPKEQINAVIASGTIVIGRAALLRNITQLLEEVTGVRFFVAVNPSAD